nr:hypothetical protein [uncultured bacterium]
MQISDNHFVGLPISPAPGVTEVTHLVQALDNFLKVFAIRPKDKVLILSDSLLDPRVIQAVSGAAKARGAQVRVYAEPSCQVTEIPHAIHGLLEDSTFVVSSWFCSVMDPLALKLRKQGQRWVKITYFRNFDLLQTPQARFPIELVGEITRATADRYPKGEAFDLVFSDERGTRLVIPFTAAMRDAQLANNRWRGKMAADEDGCYVHYLPTHGPNLWDQLSVGMDYSITVPVSGVIYPQWAVGFPKPFEERIAVHFDTDRVASVVGESADAKILREMLVGGRLIEGGGCGFNPKAPRHTVYPAGSNSPGALHFGIDLIKPSDYIRKVMPDWEEPPIHMDLVTLDSTVRAGDNLLIDHGFLCALRDPKVVETASRYGDPVELLEAHVS